MKLSLITLKELYMQLCLNPQKESTNIPSLMRKLKLPFPYPQTTFSLLNWKSLDTDNCVSNKLS